MLWRTLEVLVASFHPRELSAGDPSFAKLLSCARSAVDNASYWSFPPDHVLPAQVSGEDHASVYVFAVRVVTKLASRGECEREVMVRGGMASSIVCSLQPPPTQQRQDAHAVTTALNALLTLTRGAKYRCEMADVVPLSLEMMALHPREAAVQLASCKLLQQLLQEPSGKERIPRAHGVPAVVNALRSFPNELPLATAGLDVLTVMCTHSGWSSPSAEGLGERMQEVTMTVATVLSVHRRAAQVVEARAKLLSR